MKKEAVLILALLMFGCKKEPNIAEKNVTIRDTVKKEMEILRQVPVEQTAVKENKKTDCKEITGDMMSGEECLISGSSVENVYKEIIDKKLIEDSKYLLKELPKKDTKVEGKENGPMEINYKMANKLVTIDMEYAGGVTSIELEQKPDGIKRKITHSAD
jgi:Sec-independent protein translocase protein TatA